MPTIHPLACVDPSAKLGEDVKIGPFCVVEAEVELGDGCILESHAVVKTGSILGKQNHLFEGAIVGGRPQHLRAGNELGRVIIGSGNQIREGSTIHRGLAPGKDTIIGDNNLIMAVVHIAHDCHIGSNVIIANNTMFGGHVHVDDRAFISGAVGIHQFCRVGSLAMVGGQSHIVQDIPPFMLVDGKSSQVVGLNNVGLRRGGFTSEQIHQLKAAYRTIYRSGLPWKEVLQQLAFQFTSGPAACYHAFLNASKRGIVQERRAPRGATIKLRTVSDETPAESEAAPQRKAA